MNVLQQRIGPVPVWLLGAGAAVAIWFFFLRAKPGATSGTSAASGTSPSGQATTDYSLGYSQGLQAANVQPKPAAGPPGGATITVSNPNGSTVPIWSYNISSQGVIGNVPNGTKLNTAGPAVGFHSGEPGYLVQFSGQTGWVDGSMVSQAFQGGQGGPARKHASGSRSAAPVWHDAHPKIGAPVKYQHFVRAVGGPANHQREIHRVASQAGVHPARVAMLNPVPTGMIRVA